MKLLSVTVGGFRNVARTTIELDGITALVSPNNFGKSNLIEAIQFAMDFINASPRARLSMMGTDTLVPLVPALENDNFTFEMTFSDPELGEQYRYARYGFEFSWVRDDGSGRRIVDEKIEIGPKLGRRLTTYLKRGDGKFRSRYSTRSFRRIALDDNQLAIDVLTAMEDIDINPVVRDVKFAGFVLLASLDARNQYLQSPLEIKPPSGSVVSFDNNDLPRSLYELKRRYPDKFDDFEANVFTLFPEFTTMSVQSYEIKPEDRDFYTKTFSPKEGEGAQVPFRIKDELYRLMIKSEYLNQPVSVSRMSLGTQRLIWLVASSVIASVEGIQCLGIEEVETSIHPRMLKSLLEILNDSLDEASIILTSHSPYLIQYLKPERIYLGVPSSDGVATFRRISQSSVEAVREAARDRGMGFGEYLFELMSSDMDEAGVLLRWLED